MWKKRGQAGLAARLEYSAQNANFCGLGQTSQSPFFRGAPEWGLEYSIFKDLTSWIGLLLSEEHAQNGDPFALIAPGERSRFAPV